MNIIINCILNRVEKENNIEGAIVGNDKITKFFADSSLKGKYFSILKIKIQSYYLFINYLLINNYITTYKWMSVLYLLYLSNPSLICCFSIKYYVIFFFIYKYIHKYLRNQ